MTSRESLLTCFSGCAYRTVSAHGPRRANPRMLLQASPPLQPEHISLPSLALLVPPRYHNQSLPLPIRYASLGKRTSYAAMRERRRFSSNLVCSMVAAPSLSTLSSRVVPGIGHQVNPRDPIPHQVPPYNPPTVNPLLRCSLLPAFRSRCATKVATVIRNQEVQ